MNPRTCTRSVCLCRHRIYLLMEMALYLFIPIALQAQTLAEAVDAPELIWTTGGDLPWTGQTTTTHDGVDAAQSGLVADNQESWMETTVTGPGTLTFWWKVSSESGFDFLEFYLNDLLQDGRISGDVDWEQNTFDLTDGSQTLRWRYRKDLVASGGEDRGWVDLVSFAPPSGPAKILTQPQSQMVLVGSSVELSVVASGERPLFYQWFKGAAALPDATNTSYNILNFQTNDVGSYSVVVSNVLGGITSMPALLAVNTLVEAVDAPQLAWTTGGDQPWIGQTTIAHDGVDAGESGSITNNQESWMETTVTGPGTLVFSWKVSSESGFDFLEFYLDGLLQSGRISGDTDWEQRAYILGDGIQTLRWRYLKDFSDSEGQDRGWVDMINFVFASGPPEILTQPQSQTVAEGSNITLSVVAGGEFPLFYQWFKGSAALPTATNRSISILNFQTSDVGSYSVLVSNAVASVPSAPAVLELYSDIQLSLGRNGSTVVLNWTGGLGPYQVQQTTNLIQPNSWQDTGGPTQTNSMSLPIGPGRAFLRVRGQ